MSFLPVRLPPGVDLRRAGRSRRGAGVRVGLRGRGHRQPGGGPPALRRRGRRNPDRRPARNPEPLRHARRGGLAPPHGRPRRGGAGVRRPCRPRATWSAPPQRCCWRRCRTGRSAARTIRRPALPNWSSGAGVEPGAFGKIRVSSGPLRFPSGQADMTTADTPLLQEVAALLVDALNLDTLAADIDLRHRSTATASASIRSTSSKWRWSSPSAMASSPPR